MVLIYMSLQQIGSVFYFQPLVAEPYYDAVWWLAGDQLDHKFLERLAFQLKLPPVVRLVRWHSDQSIVWRHPVPPTLRDQNKRCSNTSSKFASLNIDFQLQWQ